jgi:hypothetical protein
VPGPRGSAAEVLHIPRGPAAGSTRSPSHHRPGTSEKGTHLPLSAHGPMPKGDPSVGSGRVLSGDLKAALTRTRSIAVGATQV